MAAAYRDQRLGVGRRVWCVLLFILGGALTAIGYTRSLTPYGRGGTLPHSLTQLAPGQLVLAAALAVAAFGLAAASRPSGRPDQLVFRVLALVICLFLVLLMWVMSVNFHRDEVQKVSGTVFSQEPVQFVWVGVVAMLVASILLAVPSRLGVPIAFAAGSLTVIAQDPRLRGDVAGRVGAFDVQQALIVLVPVLGAAALFAYRATHGRAWWATVLGLVWYCATLSGLLQLDDSDSNDRLLDFGGWIAPTLLLPPVMIGCEIVWRVADRPPRAPTAAVFTG